MTNSVMTAIFVAFETTEVHSTTEDGCDPEVLNTARLRRDRSEGEWVAVATRVIVSVADRAVQEEVAVKTTLIY